MMELSVKQIMILIMNENHSLKEGYRNRAVKNLHLIKLTNANLQQRRYHECAKSCSINMHEQNESTTLQKHEH